LPTGMQGGALESNKTGDLNIKIYSNPNAHRIVESASVSHLFVVQIKNTNKIFLLKTKGPLPCLDL
ncbi:MAG: hypothetical protein ABUT20_31070, partial [Bacteroidota bacterium]